MLFKSNHLFTHLLTPDRTIEELNEDYYKIILERLFKLSQRNTTITKEVKCGILHFISCSFILAINPTLLAFSEGKNSIAAATAISTGVSCIICGLFSNLPFILAPTTSTSLYFSLYLKYHDISLINSKYAIFLLGILFLLSGKRSIAMTITNLIPYGIKVGLCIGVGLLIALESLIEIGFVQTGEYTILHIGDITFDIFIFMITFIIIGLALYYKIRGAFLIGLFLGSFLHFIYVALTNSKSIDFTWPYSLFINRVHMTDNLSIFQFNNVNDIQIYRLIFDLYVIGVILLNGLSHGLADTAGLKRDNDTVPRGKWLYAACGLGTMLSAILGSGPIMISPESAPGIKAGARSGLSTCVCGLLFLLFTIFCPIFARIPTTGISPILLIIGFMLFENAKNVNWSEINEALPVFVMMIVIPFTYSIFNGVIFGYLVYLIFYIIINNSLLKCYHKIKKIFKKVKKFIQRYLYTNKYNNLPTFISSEMGNISPRNRQVNVNDDTNEDSDIDSDIEIDNALFSNNKRLSFHMNEIDNSEDNNIISDEIVITFDDRNILSQPLSNLIGDEYKEFNDEKVQIT